MHVDMSRGDGFVSDLIPRCVRQNPELTRRFQLILCPFNQNPFTRR